MYFSRAAYRQRKSIEADARHFINLKSSMWRSSRPARLPWHSETFAVGMEDVVVESNMAPELPSWIQDHMARYIATDGADGYLWDASLGGGRPQYRKSPYAAVDFRTVRRGIRGGRLQGRRAGASGLVLESAG